MATHTYNKTHTPHAKTTEQAHIYFIRLPGWPKQADQAVFET